MKKYIGGYSILDLASTTIYADALGALKQDKPVLVYDTPECYYADTISLDGTNVVITKGGKTITIANDNTITNVSDIQNHLYRYAITLSDTNNAHFTILVNVNEKIDEEITDIKDLYKYFTVGDIVLDGNYEDSFNKWLAIYTDMNTHQFAGIKDSEGTLEFNDNSFSNTWSVVEIIFIKKIL